MILPRDKKGRFIKGYHYSPATELKKGQHWRSPQPFWQKEWLENEYINKKHSAREIAKQFNTTENNIYYWLRKHKIPRRKMTEIRKIKYWGLRGEKNGMYGRRGELSPMWQGGNTPFRQQIYSKLEWQHLKKKIKERDKNICQFCLEEKEDKELEYCHLLPISCFPEYAIEEWNVFRGCKKCHKENTFLTYRVDTTEDLYNAFKRVLQRKQPIKISSNGKIKGTTMFITFRIIKV